MDGKASQSVGVGEGSGGDVLPVRTMAVGELMACLRAVWPDHRLVVRGIDGRAFGVVGVGLSRCEETDGERRVMVVLDVA